MAKNRTLWSHWIPKSYHGKEEGIGRKMQSMIEGSYLGYECRAESHMKVPM